MAARAASIRPDWQPWCPGNTDRRRDGEGIGRSVGRKATNCIATLAATVQECTCAVPAPTGTRVPGAAPSRLASIRILQVHAQRPQLAVQVGPFQTDDLGQFTDAAAGEFQLVHEVLALKGFAGFAQR